jgi:hypothetical protein
MVHRILASAALLLTLVTPAVATETLYVQAAAELRQSPSGVARSLRALEPGQRVESYGRRGDWVNVRVPASASEAEATGWVHPTQVGPSPPGAAAEAEQREQREQR